MSELSEVVEETTGESAVEETPDHTPEAEVETETVETVTEETEESVETDEQSDVSPVEEVEFSTDPIPPDEVIDKLRIKPEDREQLKNVAKIARETSKQLEDFGGEFAISTLSPLARILPKATATDDEVIDTLNSIIDANPTIAGQLGFEFATSVFSHEESFNAIFRKNFGENATYKNIKNLLALDAEGLVEKDPDLIGYEPTEMRDLKNQVETLKQQLAQKDAPEVDTRAVRAVKDFESDIPTELAKKIEPQFEKFKWDIASDTAKFVSELVLARLKSSEDYTNTVALIQNAGRYRDGDKRASVIEANISVLKRKAEAMAFQLTKSIQADRRKAAETARNVIVKEKQINPPKEVQPEPLPNIAQDPMAAQAQARERFKASLSAG